MKFLRRITILKKVTGYRLQVTVGRILQSLFALFLFLYPIPYTLYPAYAACTPGTSPVNIGDCFGFTGPKFSSLGQATSLLVMPTFSVAAFLVVLYFLLGAFRFLKAGGNKEDMESARQMINHAIVGFFILMLAFLIIQFVPQFFHLEQVIDIIR